MKTFHFSLIRCLIAVVLGLLLIMWPQLALINLIKAVGILFLLPGIISLSSYVYKRYKKTSAKVLFPFEALGGALLGVWLIASPTFFINSIMYVLGLLLLVGAIYQLFILFMLKRLQPVSAWLYLLPVLILAIGFVIFFNPDSVMANIVSVFGIICLLYGCLELVYSFLVYRKYEKAIVVESKIKTSTPDENESTAAMIEESSIVEEVQAEEVK